MFKPELDTTRIYVVNTGYFEEVERYDIGKKYKKITEKDLYKQLVGYDVNHSIYYDTESIIDVNKPFKRTKNWWFNEKDDRSLYREVNRKYIDRKFLCDCIDIAVRLKGADKRELVDYYKKCI